MDLSQFKSPNTLMIQGCTSDAGKTVMVAGIGRVLQRRGIKVAPFKPQNMALNSAVTKDGGEIGRAQALQAYACGVDAQTDFNPVLLKPSSDTGAQVIIHGQAISAMQAADFHDYKRTAMNAVMESYKRLQESFNCIIVEGAGSPAEINLRQGDIANMGFAENADCPVILVADIDRGGVFAHLLGTLELLSKSEQDRVVGFIINRFRGDISLLKSGLEWLEKRTGKPVLGVVPYLHDLYLDAEDAINTQQTKANNQFKIVVPVLPRISNHTDFDALRLSPHIDLEFVSIKQPCPAADLIILAGSKNVISDLNQLKEYGWQQALEQHLRYKGKLIGICGGYQMLGQLISDPHGIENDGKTIQVNGFGFLDCDSELKHEKQLTQSFGKLIHPDFESSEVSGYEIHCGQTRTNEATLMQLESGEFDGSVSSDGQILGTYLHGCFDQASSANALLKWAGLNKTSKVNLNDVREQQLNRLADCLEKHLEASLFTNIINAGGTR